MNPALRPTGGLPGWASGASGYITQPIPADLAQGFLPTGVARSSYFNFALNRLGQWATYLDEHRRRAAYDRLAADDFCRGLPAVNATGATAFGPLWDIQNAQIVEDYQNAAAGAAKLALGVSGVGHLKSYVQSVGQSGFFYEALVRVSARGGSGSAIEIGLLGVSILDAHAAFTSTGPSGLYNFACLPSGSINPTMIALNIDPLASPTGYRTFGVEAYGPTMTVTVDGVLQGAMPAIAGMFPFSEFGVRITNATGSSMSVFIDRLEAGRNR